MGKWWAQWHSILGAMNSSFEMRKSAVPGRSFKVRKRYFRLIPGTGWCHLVASPLRKLLTHPYAL
jgi:hypothetical protein